MVLARRYGILIRTDWPLLDNQFLSIKPDVWGWLLFNLRMVGVVPNPALRWPINIDRSVRVYSVSRQINPEWAVGLSREDKSRYIAEIISALQQQLFQEIYG